MNNELLAVIEHLERERGLDRETLLQSVEGALLSAARKSVGPSRNLRVDIDRKSFKVRIMATVEVVDKRRTTSLEISLEKAALYKPDVKVGDVIEAEITPENFGRIAAQNAKQAIMHRIRQAEKDRVYEEYKNKVGEMVSGQIKRFDRSDVVVEIPKGEGIMPMRERVPTEEYQAGERIKAYILAVENSHGSPEIILSRSHPNFVRKLFEMEVSEIGDGTVEIRAMAREAGYRTKIAVHSKDDKIDPVGACVGMRGIRVKNIVRELGGEKVDIVRWTDDIRAMVINALSPAKLSKVEVDESTRTVRLVVDQDQLSLAIGRKGQNARLTSKLTGWKIDIHRTGPELDFQKQVEHAVVALQNIEGISQEQAAKLVHSGFLSLEGLMAATSKDLVDTEEFTESEANAILRSAEKHFESTQGRFEE